MDPLEEPDHGIRLADLRQLVPRDLQALQDFVGLLLGQQPMFGDEYVVKRVEPQGWACRSCSPRSHAAVRAGPRGFSKPPRRAKAFSHPGPPGFLPLSSRLKARCSF